MLNQFSSALLDFPCEIGLPRDDKPILHHLQDLPRGEWTRGFGSSDDMRPTVWKTGRLSPVHVASSASSREPGSNVPWFPTIRARLIGY